MRYTLKQRLFRFTGQQPVFFYLFSIAFLTLCDSGRDVLSGLYLRYAQQITLNGGWGFVNFGGGSTGGFANQLAFYDLGKAQTELPRMDFSDGIPAECRTLVIVPTMISSRAYIDELVEALEIRFLANREANLHFGLLTDFVDADTEFRPEDDDLLKWTKGRIEALNEQYSRSEEAIFFLFHRPRRWNPSEQKWMGYERKRGKLSALNAFIRGRSEGEFSLVIGKTDVLRQVKYVITLDSDTQLPRESVWKFIATMAHPLNQAIYSPEKSA